MAAWLQKQKKGELLDLAKEAGLRNTDGLLKDDLIESLEKHLRDHQSSLGTKSAFSDFYGRLSPTKRDRVLVSVGGSEGDREPKPARQRRKTIKSEEDDADTPIKKVVAKTPRAIQRVASGVPLPRSPASAAKQRVQEFTGQVSKAMDEAGVSENVDAFRHQLSNVHSISLILLVLEGLAIQPLVLPWVNWFDIPANPSLRFPQTPIYGPNVYMLASQEYWSWITVWLTTSVGLPLLAAYFCNMTLGAKASFEKKFDPFTFHVVKAMVAWLVFGQGITLGLANSLTIRQVNSAFFGGYQFLLLGSAIGMVASVYDAILRGSSSVGRRS
ncbi:hypothetical protein P152DRAFT_60891 [Eremomyces bilateralis CBS 781.70]|uniref:Uncharacterized protein n=1 Tax=Eremomyces bilateralis CBS 781.70 TaxID=1392243 RepID=A0A6G1G0R3_9PEZI|nr:uncharacterized protein P152DRAFT_60891 [Eremomyces bilateralis CBS 781.70]KAF1811608.1 hypothetical protein P152DRAFT_60891 [Eremomyces bilateralis CBS 781.70]